MAKRRKRRSTRRQTQASYPGWLWMMFGLAIGLSVAFAVYVKNREPQQVARTTPLEPASMQSAIDNNGETTSSAEETPPAEPIEKRFDFYDMLPLAEFTIDDEQPVVDADVEPQAIDEPGVYMLQAGSFSTNADADRRRAELGLHGVESHIGRATVNGRQYFRVYVGPIDDLRELNVTRSRLRAAKVDVLRIRLGD